MPHYYVSEDEKNDLGRFAFFMIPKAAIIFGVAHWFVQNQFDEEAFAALHQKTDEAIGEVARLGQVKTAADFTELEEIKSDVDAFTEKSWGTPALFLSMAGYGAARFVVRVWEQDNSDYLYDEEKFHGKLATAAFLKNGFSLFVFWYILWVSFSHTNQMLNLVSEVDDALSLKPVPDQTQVDATPSTELPPENQPVGAGRIIRHDEYSPLYKDFSAKPAAEGQGTSPQEGSGAPAQPVKSSPAGASSSKASPR